LVINVLLLPNTKAFMKKTFLILTVVAIAMLTPKTSFGWGRKGHQLVAEIAFKYLDDSTKAKVKHYLGKLSIEEAGTWMDDMRSNDYYRYMSTWHYVDVSKDSVFHVTAEHNAVTVLNSAIVSLKHKETLKDRQIKEYLLLIFHLVGDLHQPLHTGYPEDKGGNTVQVSAPNYSGNLHSFWDTEILDAKNITIDSCVQYYSTLSPKELKSATTINVLKWMRESRSLLDSVYNFKDNTIPPAYEDANAVIVQKQLLFAGLRLASILKEVFNNG